MSINALGPARTSWLLQQELLTTNGKGFLTKPLNHSRNPSVQTFPKSHRLKTSLEFQRVFAKQCYAADETLVINGLSPNARQVAPDTPLDIGVEEILWTKNCPARLGLSIGKAVGNAPLRNRWKRLIREAFRRHAGRWPSGWDFVVRPRKGASPQFAAVESSLIALVARLERQVARQADRPSSTRRQSPPRQS